MLGLVYLALLWSFISFAFSIVVVSRRYLLGRRFRQEAPSRRRPPPSLRALLIRPCAGHEEHLERCLSSLMLARYGFRLDVVIAVNFDDDTALPAARRSLDALRGSGVEAKIEVHPPHGVNRKATLLAGVMRDRSASYDVILNADSDIDLAGFDLDVLVAPVVNGQIRDRAIAATWAPFHEVSEHPGLGNRASVATLGGALTSFPLLCGVDPEGLVGKLWALDCGAIGEFGGFGALTDVLGEDFEMARRLRRAGRGVTVVPLLATSRARPQTVADVIMRSSRWVTVIRAQRPALLLTYPLLFFPTGGILLLSALTAGARPQLALLAATTAAAGRLWVALAAQHWCGQRPRPGRAFIDVLLADLVVALGWARAVYTRRIIWRGRSLRVKRGGRLVER